MFKEILAILLSSLVELLIAGSLGLTVPEESSDNTTINWAISIWFLFVPVILLPVTFVYVFHNSRDNQQEKMIKQRFEPLV